MRDSLHTIGPWFFDYTPIDLSGNFAARIDSGSEGNIAILKQLLAIDTRLEGVAVNPYF